MYRKVIIFLLLIRFSSFLGSIEIESFFGTANENTKNNGMGYGDIYNLKGSLYYTDLNTYRCSKSRRGGVLVDSISLTRSAPWYKEGIIYYKGVLKYSKRPFSWDHAPAQIDSSQEYTISNMSSPATFVEYVGYDHDRYKATIRNLTKLDSSDGSIYFKGEIIKDELAPTGTFNLTGFTVSQLNGSEWIKESGKTLYAPTIIESGSGLLYSYWLLNGVQQSSPDVTIVPGVNHIQYYVEDKLGNNDILQDLTIKLDNTIPDIGLENPEVLTPIWTNEPFRLEVNPSDSGGSRLSTKYWMVGITKYNNINYVDLDTLHNTNSSYSATYYVVDRAGNPNSKGPFYIKIFSPEDILSSPLIQFRVKDPSFLILSISNVDV